MRKRKLFLGLLIMVSQAAFGQWEKLETENLMGRVSGMYATSDTLYTAGDAGVFASVDGSSWNFSGGGTFNGFYFATGVIVTDTALIESSSYGVFYSRYNQNWTKVGDGAGLPKDKYKDVVTNDERVFVQSSGGYIYSFSPAIGTWQQENIPATSNTLSSNGKDVLVGYSNYYGAYRYDKESSSWSSIGFFKNEVVNEFFQKGDTIVAVYKKAGDSIAISKDNGTSWIKNAMPLSAYIASFELNDTVLFAGIYGNTPNSGFFISLDDGTNWTLATAGLADSSIKDVRIFKGYIYASTAGDGIYRRPLSQLSGIIYNGEGKLEAIKVKNATYQWFFNGAPIEGATGRTLLAMENGTYKVNITYHDPGIRVAQLRVLTYEYKVTDLTVSNVVSKADLSGIFSATYDPFTQSLHILTAETGYPSQLMVYNLVGQSLIKMNKEGQEVSMDMSGLQAGTYIVKMNLGKNIHTIKVYKY